MLQEYLRHLIQVADIQNLNLDKKGEEIVQLYFNKIENELNANAQKVFDKTVELFSLYSNLNDPNNKEVQHGYFISIAADELSKINQKLIPDFLKNGKASLNYETMKEWQKQLTSIKEEMFFIYLHWCAYIINNN